MNLEVPKSDLPSKLLTPWWDVCIHYVTAAMLALSLTAIGLQTTKDNLVCIPTVDCAAFERNASYHALNVCSKLELPQKERLASATVVLTKMDDRRQYDYVDYECYGQMLTFPAFFSLFFFGETLLLLVISNFWLKYTKTSCALTHFERLLSEFNHGEILAYEQLLQDPHLKEYNAEELRIKVSSFHIKMGWFFEQYESKDSHKSISSITVQYRLRITLGMFFSVVLLILNNILYVRSGNFSQCRLSKALFLTGHEHFECIRPIESYYKVMAFSFSGLLAGNFLFLMRASYWAIKEVGWKPSFKNPHFRTSYYLLGDLAFLTQLLENSSKVFQNIGNVGQLLINCELERDLKDLKLLHANGELDIAQELGREQEENMNQPARKQADKLSQSPLEAFRRGRQQNAQHFARMLGQARAQKLGREQEENMNQQARKQADELSQSPLEAFRPGHQGEAALQGEERVQYRNSYWV